MFSLDIYCSKNCLLSLSSGVEIYFTEDDYRANEASNNNLDVMGNVPVRVAKTTQIANAIVLEVVPLTVAMTNTDTLSALYVPADNPFSPPYAGDKINLFPWHILWKCL